MSMFKSIWKHYKEANPVKRSEVLVCFALYNIFVQFGYMIIPEWIGFILTGLIIGTLIHSNRLSKKYFKKRKEEIEKRFKERFKELNKQFNRLKIKK